MKWSHSITVGCIEINTTRTKIPIRNVKQFPSSIDFNATNNYGMTLFHFAVHAYSFRTLAIVDFYSMMLL